MERSGLGHSQPLEGVFRKGFQSLLETAVHRVVGVDHLPIGGCIPQVSGDECLKADVDEFLGRAMPDGSRSPSWRPGLQFLDQGGIHDELLSERIRPGIAG